MKKLVSVFMVILLCLTLISPSVVYSATIKITKTKLSLNVGKTYTLKITGTTKAPKWTTSKKSVASVNSKGKITAVAKGTATITATINKKQYKCVVTVKDPKVDVVFRAVISDGSSINDYVKTIQDPDFIAVKVYDDNHYKVTMLESKRRKLLKDFDKELGPIIKQILKDPNYKNYLTSIKYNALLTEIKVYTPLESVDVFTGMATLLPFVLYNDYYQALNLIDVKDRYITLKVINNSTKKVIYSYDSRKN